jgi:ribose transport system permease protein
MGDQTFETTSTVARWAADEGSAAARYRADRVREFAPLATLIVLTIVVAFFSPTFVQKRSLLVLADAVAPLLLLALGQTAIILMGCIDLSLTAIAAMASIAAATLLPYLGGWAVPAGVLVGTACGLINGLIYTRARIPSFITTLGTLGLWTGVGLSVTNAQPVFLGMETGAFNWIVGGSLGFPNTAWIALVAIAVCFVILRFTPLGRYIYAIGVGEAATWLSGVPVDRYKVLAFGLAGTCAGLAGIVLAAQLYAGGPDIARNLLLPAVAAVIVGGTAITGGVGGVMRTFVGSLIIIVARIGMDAAGVDVYAQQLVYGAIVILAVTLTIDRSKVLVIK